MTSKKLKEAVEGCKTIEEVIKLRAFNKFFKPLDEPEMSKGSTWQFEAADEAKKIASQYDENNLYRHIWTAVDGEGSDIILLNGWHACNRLFYIVCETPWGSGEESDKDIYIEAQY